MTSDELLAIIGWPIGGIVIVATVASFSSCISLIESNSTVEKCQAQIVRMAGKNPVSDREMSRGIKSLDE